MTTPPMLKSATISPDGKYRYDLTRFWAGAPPVLWCMLNPSTADADIDDPTIRRVIRFTRDNMPDAGGVVVVNLYALRATRPVHLLDDRAASLGPANRSTINAWLAGRPLAGVVCAWGAWHATQNAKQYGNSIARINFEGLADRVGHRPVCLGTTRAGAPKHPLYVPASTPFQPFAVQPA